MFTVSNLKAEKNKCPLFRGRSSLASYHWRPGPPHLGLLENAKVRLLARACLRLLSSGFHTIDGTEGMYRGYQKCE